jgi:hypothetical protein
LYLELFTEFNRCRRSKIALLHTYYMHRGPLKQQSSPCQLPNSYKARHFLD